MPEDVRRNNCQGMPRCLDLFLDDGREAWEEFELPCRSRERFELTIFKMFLDELTMFPLIVNNITDVCVLLSQYPSYKYL